MDLQELQTLLGARPPLALVTVADVKGSSPRHPGSAMVVSPAGIRGGSIGGGKGEAMAIAAAQGAMVAGQSAFIEVEMLSSEVEGPALICGGINRMVVELVQNVEPYALAQAMVKEGRRALVVRSLGKLGRAEAPATIPLNLELSILDEGGKLVWGKAPNPAPGSATLAKVLATGRAILTEGPEGAVLVDPLLPPEKLLILGGGHVGQALAKAAIDLGFEITVADDREDFAAPGRFPQGVRTVQGGYTEIVDAFPFDLATYAVTVSRGHLFDLECSRAVLRRPFRYAGLIGSKRKVALIREQLLADGLDPAIVASLHSPIGLGIGAETPAEIAISILGEIIALRHGIDLSKA